MGEGNKNNSDSIQLSLKLEFEGYYHIEFVENFLEEHSNLLSMLDFVSVFCLYEEQMAKSEGFSSKYSFGKDLVFISNSLYVVQCYYAEFKEAIFDFLQCESPVPTRIKDNIVKIAKMFSSKSFHRLKKEKELYKEIQNILGNKIDDDLYGDFVKMFRNYDENDVKINNKDIELAFDKILKRIKRKQYYDRLLPFYEYRGNSNFHFIKFNTMFLALILSNKDGKDGESSITSAVSYFLENRKLLDVLRVNNELLDNLRRFINDDRVKINNKYRDGIKSKGCYAMICHNNEIFYSFSGNRKHDEANESYIVDSMMTFFNALPDYLKPENSTFCKLRGSVQRFVNLGATKYNYYPEISDYGTDVSNAKKQGGNEESVQGKNNPYGCSERRIIAELKKKGIQMTDHFVLCSRWKPCFKCIPAIAEFSEMDIVFINEGPNDTNAEYIDRVFGIRNIKEVFQKKAGEE